MAPEPILEAPEGTDQPDLYVGVASADMTPEEVVGKQVQSIRDAVDSPESIRECFALASPGNRKLTGPVERFADMVMTEPYAILAKAPEIQVGTAVTEDEYAAVLVTAVAETGVPAAFRFILERQALAPYEGCWMTVAVEVVTVESGTNGLSANSLR
ncbi:MAG: hypothetical protein Aurels2KO_37230 [Aureliella sp.]